MLDSAILNANIELAYTYACCCYRAAIEGMWEGEYRSLVMFIKVSSQMRNCHPVSHLFLATAKLPCKTPPPSNIEESIPASKGPGAPLNSSNLVPLALAQAQADCSFIRVTRIHTSKAGTS